MERRNRKAEQSEATQGLLVGVATEVFAERGYAEASIEEICTRAGVTRGALYHHYRGKEDLFREVFRKVEERLVQRVGAAAAGERDFWKALDVAIDVTLRASVEAEVRQIVLRDATSVLGWEASREVMEAYALGAFKAMVQQGIDGGALRPAPVEAAAHVLLGALMEGSALVAEAPASEFERVRTEVAAVLGGLAAGLAAET